MSGVIKFHKAESHDPDHETRFHVTSNPGGPNFYATVLLETFLTIRRPSFKSITHTF